MTPDEKRNRQARISRDKSAAVREVGPLPAVVDADRRNSCLLDFGLFALTYFPTTFPLPFGPPHRQMIARMQRCTADGGLAAVAAILRKLGWAATNHPGPAVKRSDAYPHKLAGRH